MARGTGQQVVSSAFTHEFAGSEEVMVGRRDVERQLASGRRHPCRAVDSGGVGARGDAWRRCRAGRPQLGREWCRLSALRRGPGSIAIH